jgi:branched-chain amino acid transport system ATP-binding protein
MFNFSSKYICNPPFSQHASKFSKQRFCMNVLDISNLEVSYGGIRALKGVSLSVAEGQITVLLGANGAGKSTLLKAVSGLVKPAKGTIKLWGQDVASLKPYEITALGVAHVPEGRGMFPGLSVRENLQMGAYLAPTSEIQERLESALHLFPRLRERFTQLAGSLSGGCSSKTLAA